jgi:type IV secretory pathway TrbF-like protein
MEDPTLTSAPSANGHGMPLDWQGVPDDVIQRLELAYQEIQRRDSQAEVRATRKDTLATRQWYVILGLLLVLVWLAVDKSRVRAFVQTVQVTEEGMLVQLGQPVDLYDYEPPDGSYLEMASQWIRWVRWRGEDTNMLEAQWAWAYRHTCGTALKALKAYEKIEKPFAKGGKKKVGIEVKSVTKGGTPQSYTVIWDEHVTEKNVPTVKTQSWSATLTTGRIVLKKMEDILDNRLGLCVTGYDWAEQPS